MPIYVFQCPTCPSFEVFEHTMCGRPSATCPECGRSCGRDWKAEQAAGHSDQKPFFSQSRGVIYESERLPGEIYNDDHNLLIKSRRHSAEINRKLGLSELKKYG